MSKDIYSKNNHSSKKNSTNYKNSNSHSKSSRNNNFAKNNYYLNKNNKNSKKKNNYVKNDRNLETKEIKLDTLNKAENKSLNKEVISNEITSLKKDIKEVQEIVDPKILNFKKLTKEEEKALSSDELFDYLKLKKEYNAYKRKERARIKELEAKKLEETNVLKREDIELNKEISKETVNKHADISAKSPVDFVSNDDKTRPIETDYKSKEDNLIITKEITFTNMDFDIGDKNLIADLKDAIADYDRLDEEDASKTKEIFVKSTHKKKSFFQVVVSLFREKYIYICIFLLFAMLFIIYGFGKSQSLSKHDDSKVVENNKNEEIRNLKIQQEKDFNDCIDRPFDERDKTDEMLIKEEELRDYLVNKYKASVLYEDLSNGFTFSYNDDVTYYAASTIKILDALYLYTKAANGEVDLGDTIVFTKKFGIRSGHLYSDYEYGDKIPLRTIITYDIHYSDNLAHAMLVDYIGKSNLRNFATSLGAKNVLNTGDNFGNITVHDAICYVKALNEFILSNGSLGNELKNIFVNALQNDLAISNLGIAAAHKYGEYNSYYHDIGIVYDKNPYVIAILTTEGRNDFESIIRDINEHVYELHAAYYENRNNMCKVEVYGK